MTLMPSFDSHGDTGHFYFSVFLGWAVHGGSSNGLRSSAHEPNVPQKLAGGQAH